MVIKSNDIKEFEKRHKMALPSDIGSETSVVATVLSHPEYIYKSEYLHPRMFKERELGCIYHIVKRICDEGVNKIDNFLVINEIEGNKGYKEIFSSMSNINDIDEYLDDLKLVSRGSVEEYDMMCKKVVGTAFKRESYIKLTEMATGVLTSKEEINEINYRLQTELVKFADTYIVNTDVKVIGEKIEELWNEIERERNSGFAGIPSKFKGLNQYFTYENGELVVIGGRAKSRFCSLM